MRILIADDDVDVRMLVRGLVEKLGHECAEASNGNEAWALFTHYKPEMLVLDRVMPPGPDGFELCRSIRAFEHRTLDYAYIMLLTLPTSRDDVLEGIRAGADDHVAKPLDPFVLQARLLVARRVTLLHQEIRRYRTELAVQAATDPLTGLNNRLRLDDELSRLHALSTRYGRAYAVALCDIDHFKLFNDTHGHQAGDDALRKIATTLSRSGRQGDVVYRYGGEEFLLVLPEQNAESAAVALERLRSKVEELAIPNPAVGEGRVLTISVGISAFVPGSGAGSAALLGHADAALYGAKAEGRNRVRVAEVPTILEG